MLKNALATFRDRGPLVFLTAGLNDIQAKVQKHLLKQRFIVRKIHDYRMYLDLEDSGISRSLLLFATRELDHKIILEKVLKPGMKVLDIGANIGYYVLMELGLIGRQGKLIAIEPSPSNVSLLKKNLALNGYNNIQVIEGAVSEKSGEKEFYLAHHSNLNTFHNVGTGTQHLSGKVIKVRTYTVPEIVKDEPIDLIRMDVEGHEVEVLNGLIPAIEAGIQSPMIIFETHLSRYSPEHDMEAVLRKLFSLGYKTKFIGSSYERGTEIINGRGYVGTKPFPTDGMTRVVYEDIKDEDTIDFVCKTGGARTVLLHKPTLQ